MKRFVPSMLCLWVALLMGLTSRAADTKDFVSLLIDKASEETESSEKDYECTQIGPSMLNLMVYAMEQDNKLGEGDRETIKTLISQMKSICMFSSHDRHDYYYGLATGMLETQEDVYEPLALSNQPDEASSVWCRRSGSEVIELVVVNYKEGAQFNIVGVTGNIDEELLSSLMSLHL